MLEVKEIFDKLREASGGKLTQAQVDAANQLMKESSEEVLRKALNLRTNSKECTTCTKVTSTVGKELIKQFEGLKLTSYDDGVGVWTIGYRALLYILLGLKLRKEKVLLKLKQKNTYRMI